MAGNERDGGEVRESDGAGVAGEGGVGGGIGRRLLRAKARARSETETVLGAHRR